MGNVYVKLARPRQPAPDLLRPEFRFRQCDGERDGCEE